MSVQLSSPMQTVSVENKVKQVVSNIRNLPTPPIVFHQIQKVINDPKVNALQIANILAEDPAMSVKVLKLTNSAFYGLSREVESVRQAVVIVGFEAIRNLVLSAAVLDMFKGQSVDQEFQERFWRHSLATAFCCRILAKQHKGEPPVDPDAAFSAGLLHDIGKIVMCCYLPDEYTRFKKERESDKINQTHEVEERVLGYSHAEIGTILAAHWKLPHKLIEAITYHHNPAALTSSDSITYVVHIANYIAKKTFYDEEDMHLVGRLEPGAIEFLHANIDQLEIVGEHLRDEYAKAETFMKMAGLA